VTAGTLLLWRHGLTEYNLTQRMQGQVDIPLGIAGLAHAARAAAVLAEHKPTVILSSDLHRARATAEMLASLTGLEVRYDARLRERSFGSFEGLTRAEMGERWPEEFAAWRRGEEVATIGIEPRAAVAARVSDCITETAQEMPDEGVLVAVGHGSAISAGVTRLIGLPPDGWHGIAGMDNCHWARLRANTGRRPDWVLTAYNVGVL
jgi:broad specificity phosphatase PhoE